MGLEDLTGLERKTCELVKGRGDPIASINRKLEIRNPTYAACQKLNG